MLMDSLQGKSWACRRTTTWPDRPDRSSW